MYGAMQRAMDGAMWGQHVSKMDPQPERLRKRETCCLPAHDQANLYPDATLSHHPLLLEVMREVGMVPVSAKQSTSQRPRRVSDMPAPCATACVWQQGPGWP